MAALRRFHAHRELIAQLVRRDVAQRYRGSQLGVVWSLVTPLATLAIYTFVFSVVLKARWGLSSGSSPAEFALALFAGLIPFGVFAEVATKAPGLVLGSPNFVKKVVFPLEVLPIVTLGSALVHSLVGVCILSLGVLLFTGRLSPVCLAFLPLAYVPLILFSLAVGWALSSLGVFVRDIGNGIGLAVQLLMFMSPIVYPLEAVPQSLRHLLWLNPMTTIVEVFRTLIVWQHLPPWGAWLAWTAAGGVLAWLSHAWFVHLRPGFADVI